MRAGLDSSPRVACRERGFSLLEVLVATTIAALLAAGLTAAVQASLDSAALARARAALAREGDFALQRIASAVARSPRLLLPLADNPATAWSESVREPGVLALALDPARDSDGDGVADADNDGDGRVDEDPSADVSNDGAPGIKGIDDDGDGAVDEGQFNDDDEDGVIDEDPVNGIDDDGDGAVDEDPPADNNGDGAPGVVGVDDDGDSGVDEGKVPDDDEDSKQDEDWVDVIAFHLSGSDLVERDPNPAPASGTDYTERVIASGVTRFRVERIASPGARAILVDLVLDLASASGETLSLTTRVRVGAAR